MFLIPMRQGFFFIFASAATSCYRLDASFVGGREEILPVRAINARPSEV